MLKSIIQSESNYIKPFKIIFWSVFNLVLIPLILLLYSIKPILKIQFLKIRDERIGHLAANTELFLRRLKSGAIRKKRTLLLAIATTKPSNKQLLTMFKRKMIVIQLPKTLNDFFLNGVFFSEKSLLVKSGFGMHLPLEWKQYYKFSSRKPNLEFTSSEEKKGKQLLKKIGLADKDWFICFHARGSLYLKNKFGNRDLSHHDFRDWDIDTALKAAKYATSKGGFAIRMGALVEKKLPKLKNNRIIDYATLYRSDFGDVYLSAKCKFFLGDGCGIHQVSQIFNVPEAWVNVLSIENPPWSEKGVFIPKKWWSIEKKRFLTFKEILDTKIGYATEPNQYAKAKIRIINNTPEEILDLAIEVNERIDGNWKTTKEDEELQKKYKSLFPKNSPCYGFPSRIGAKFLRENKRLLR